MQVRSLTWEAPVEKGTTAHSSVPVWRTPRTGEPGRLQSTGSQRVGHTTGVTEHTQAASPVVKSPPSKGGDAGSIPGQGTKIPHASGQLSLNASTREPTLYTEKFVISKLKKKKKTVKDGGLH